MPLLGAGKQWSMPIIGGYVGNITTPFGWGNYNTSYYKWSLPEAGTYELHANLRVRVWGSTGFSQFRVYRVSDGSIYGGSDDVKMGFEMQNGSTYYNAQLSYRWDVTCSAADTFYLQGNASVNSSAHSLQSDGNGRPEMFWRRLN